MPPASVRKFTQDAVVLTQPLGDFFGAVHSKAQSRHILLKKGTRLGDCCAGIGEGCPVESTG